MFVITEQQPSASIVVTEESQETVVQCTGTNATTCPGNWLRIEPKYSTEPAATSFQRPQWINGTVRVVFVHMS